MTQSGHLPRSAFSSSLPMSNRWRDFSTASTLMPLSPRTQGTTGRLQDTLGGLNDLAVAERQLETVVFQAFADPAHDDIIKAMGVVVGWCMARAKRGQSNLTDDWKRFTRRQPFWKRPRKR